MKIYGKIIKDHDEQVLYGVQCFGGDVYALGDVKRGNTIDRRRIAGCSGKATQFLGGDYEHPKSTMSWGFSGHGSDLLAAWLIMRGLCLADVMDESLLVYPEEKIHREIMLRHYKAFSEEVIANLPDEWEMDTDWIKAWVMEREKKVEAV